MVVAVVYYRSGYKLEDYPTMREWDIRLLIERSRAIKCPSIQYHLAGTKKVCIFFIKYKLEHEVAQVVSTRYTN